MSPSAVLWSCQQLFSLRAFGPDSDDAMRHGQGRISLCNRQAGHKCKSQCQRQSQAPSSDAPASMQLNRRDTVVAAVLALQLPAMLPWDAAHALGFTKELKKKPKLDQYSSGETGLKYFDLQPGSGDEIVKGKVVKVHFDCMYRSLDVVSSRSARLLGANRSIAEPVEFVAGQSAGSGGVKQPAGEGAGGLFSGASGPKPPPALAQAVIGMKPGGKRSVIVPPEQGYGKQGLLEIPPDATFELQVQVLSVK
ncbi:hypothetical protein ABBQ32_003011 [Trebouxia sp. C0010 RCD-2024]